MKRQFSAGGAVYKRFGVRACLAGRQGQKSRVFWLLIKPKGGDKFHSKIRWQLPKGWIDE